MCDECQSLVIDVNVNVNVVKGGVAEFLCYKVTIRPLLLIIKEFVAIFGKVFECPSNFMGQKKTRGFPFRK